MSKSEFQLEITDPDMTEGVASQDRSAVLVRKIYLFEVAYALARYRARAF